MSENFFSRGAARQLMREIFPTKVAQPSLQLTRLFLRATFSAFEVFKIGLTLSEKVAFICFNERPLKLMKNRFYFMLKSFFFLEKFTFFCNFW